MAWAQPMDELLCQSCTHLGQSLRDSSVAKERLLRNDTRGGRDVTANNRVGWGIRPCATEEVFPTPLVVPN
jgi:hypothetical protein